MKNYAQAKYGSNLHLYGVKDNWIRNKKRFSVLKTASEGKIKKEHYALSLREAPPFSSLSVL